MDACMYVCIYICMYVCMYVSKGIYTSEHTWVLDGLVPGLLTADVVTQLTLVGERFTGRCTHVVMSGRTGHHHVPAHGHLDSQVGRVHFVLFTVWL